eukprot:Gb_30944 [translate_table: standard]
MTSTVSAIAGSNNTPVSSSGLSLPGHLAGLRSSIPLLEPASLESQWDFIVSPILTCRGYQLHTKLLLRGSRNSSRTGAFSFDRASALVEQQEAVGQRGMDFTCTIVVLERRELEINGERQGVRSLVVSGSLPAEVGFCSRTTSFINNGLKEILLDRLDEFGRVMMPKEAFRKLSHKFHGKGKLRTPYIGLSGQIKSGQTSDPIASMSKRDLKRGLVMPVGIKEEEERAMCEILGLAPKWENSPQGNHLDKREAAELLKKGVSAKNLAPGYAEGKGVEGLGFARAPHHSLSEKVHPREMKIVSKGKK